MGYNRTIRFAVPWPPRFVDMETVPRADQVEPDIAEYLASPLASFDDFAATTAPQVREHFAKLRTATEVPDVAEVTDASFAGPSGPVPVRIYRAALDRPAPAILWFHGGGWVLGNLDTAELPVRTLCAQTGCTVISVDYSLAPEAPFPAAFDDCAASLAWLRETAADLAVDPSASAYLGAWFSMAFEAVFIGLLLMVAVLVGATFFPEDSIRGFAMFAGLAPARVGSAPPNPAVHGSIFIRWLGRDSAHAQRQ